MSFHVFFYLDCSWVYRKFKDHHRSKIDKDSQVCIWICQDSWEKKGHRNTQSKHHVSDCLQMKKCIVVFYTHSEILPRIKKKSSCTSRETVSLQLFTSFSIQWDLTVLFLFNEMDSYYRFLVWTFFPNIYKTFFIRMSRCYNFVNLISYCISLLQFLNTLFILNCRYYFFWKLELN